MSDNILRHLTGALHSLQTLTMHAEFRRFQDIFDILDQFDNLREFESNINGSNIFGPVEIVPLQRLTQLKQLNLMHSLGILSDRFVENVLKNLGSRDVLEKMKLSGFIATDEFIIAIGYIVNLKELTLDSIKDLSPRHLNALGQFKQIVKFDVRFCIDVSTNDLEKNSADFTIESIANLVNKWPSLNSFYLEIDLRGGEWKEIDGGTVPDFRKQLLNVLQHHNKFRKRDIKIFPSCIKLFLSN